MCRGKYQLRHAYNVCRKFEKENFKKKILKKKSGFSVIRLSLLIIFRLSSFPSTFLSPRLGPLQPDVVAAVVVLRRPAELEHRTGHVRTGSASSSCMWQRCGVNRRRVAVRSPKRFDTVEPELPPPAISRLDFSLGLKDLDEYNKSLKRIEPICNR